MNDVESSYISFLKLAMHIRCEPEANIKTLGDPHQKSGQFCESM